MIIIETENGAAVLDNMAALAVEHHIYGLDNDEHVLMARGEVEQSRIRGFATAEAAQRALRLILAECSAAGHRVLSLAGVDE